MELTEEPMKLMKKLMMHMIRLKKHITKLHSPLYVKNGLIPASWG